MYQQVNKPKISVIIPIYNVEKYLRECLDSVINQTLKEIEIICVDDGSTDNSGKIIDEYARKDKRIKVVHKKNEGYGKAMNIGLDIAYKTNSEYIGIVEPNDFIDLKMYKNLYHVANKNNSDIVKSSFYENLQTPNKKLLRTPFWDDKIVPTTTFNLTECAWFLSKHPSIWSAIYKSSFLQQHNIKFIEAPGAGWTDNPFMVQTLCLAKRINYISTPYYFWTNKSENPSCVLKNYRIPFDRCDEIHKWLEENNITDQNILANLYKKELRYIEIAINVKSIDILDLARKIKKMSNRMEPYLINNNKFNKFERKTYSISRKHPLLWILYRRYFSKLFNF